MSILDRERTVAGPGFNRWLVPPAALAVHLSIGQVYAFSVFKLPLTRLLGVTEPAAGDWSQGAVAWIFSIAIVFLGLSAAVFGRWVEQNGPRKTIFAAACCFGGGFEIASLGVAWHQLWLVYLGYGVLGGCGLGLGYIAPVSTLVKWFPDRTGMATGMAIMGFGGGALIGSNLSLALMECFRWPYQSTGVAPTFAVLGVVYFFFMLFGAAIVRVPAEEWKPAGYEPPAVPQKMVTTASVTVDQAWRTPQFWCLWVVLCLNVTAGIGIIEQASPMIQEMFPTVASLTDSTWDIGSRLKGISPEAAAAFVALLSLFNLAGRYFWSSLSDYVGRKNIYTVYLLLGAVLYCLIPVAGHARNVPFFVGCTAIILSMYGGGFATIPAYLKDLFGVKQVGAIHGRLLTAWSVAGILGPILVNGLRERMLLRLNNGHDPHRTLVFVEPGDATGVSLYAPTMYLMAGLLIIALFCDLAVRPVAAKYQVQDHGK